MPSTYTTSFILISFCLFRFGMQPVRCDFFSSTANLERLAAVGPVVECDLIQRITDYLGAEKLEELHWKLLDGHRHLGDPPSSSTTRPAENPILAFQLIRRYVALAVLVDKVWNSAKNQMSSERSLESVESFVRQTIVNLPKGSDVEGAKRSILRIQNIYRLPVRDLLAGTIGRLDTRCPLSQQEALEIATTAIDDGDVVAGLEWLGNVQSHREPPMMNIEDFYLAVGRANSVQSGVALRDDLSKEVAACLATKGLPECEKFELKTYHREDTSTKTVRNDEIRCDLVTPSGLDLCCMSAEKSVLRNRNLQCTYDHSRSVPYQRLKVEYVNRSPDVLLFHDFVTDREVESLKSDASPLLKAAQIVDPIRGLTSEFGQRLGETAFFDDSLHALSHRLSRRVSEYTGLNTVFPAAEYLQMSNYGIGGFYHAHYDFDEDLLNEPKQGVSTATNTRLATFMIYLTDVELGGSTAFTRLRIAVRPVRNAAVFWYNYNSSAMPDVDSLHAGCPVLVGQKWVANKWFNIRGNEFQRRCPLTSTRKPDFEV